jgi:nicotinate phosphoribosyltransferase
MIIESLLDTDFYTFSVQKFAYHQFRDTQVEYDFTCRNKGIVWNEAMLNDIHNQVDYLCTLDFTNRELMFLRKQPAITQDFIEFLQGFRLNRHNITIIISDDQLRIKIIGSWVDTVMFEVPILAIVNEVYFYHTEMYMKSQENYTNLQVEAREVLNEKYEYALETGFPFSDFGTRRRFSRSWQEEVVTKLSTLPNFKGTSNVKLAMELDLEPIGTMSHQVICAGVGMKDTSVQNSQKYMFKKWAEEFSDSNLIALSDTYTFDKFLEDFSYSDLKLYDGLRQDSGDVFEWGEKAIKNYEKHNIDPKTKTLIWSDGLTVSKAREIWERFKGKINCTFGIGTSLSNDIPDVTPLQIVIKMTRCNGHPTLKVSDSPGKSVCVYPIAEDYIRAVFNLAERIK